MIEPILTGRLGNFMFEVATAYAYSLRHNCEYNIPKIGGGVDVGVIEKYLSWFPNIECNKRMQNSFALWNEPTHAYTPIPYFENVKISNYFQSEKYFKDFEHEVKGLFNLPYNRISGVVSIHVRRGDYVKYHTMFPPIDRTYLKPAISGFYNMNIKRFMVFSDDIQWCKQNLNSNHYQGCTFEYSEGRNEYEDLVLMHNCEHNIIANSTFSWWGAWLNRNPNKIVVSPSYLNWFGRKSRVETKDIIPDNWIQVRF